MVSDCCDAPIFISIETPICTECKEHCDVKEEEWVAKHQNKKVIE